MTNEPTTCEWCGATIQPRRRPHLSPSECVAALKQALAHSQSETLRLQRECDDRSDRQGELASQLTTLEIASDRLRAVADQLRQDWAASETEIIEKDAEIKRLQGALTLAQERDRVLTRACLMAREELVFGGDWTTARLIIAQALAYPGGQEIP